MRRGQVEIVHGPGDVEIAVGVEAVDEGGPLVAQVALYLEIGVEAPGQAVPLQLAAELSLQRRLRKVGDVRGHPRHRQALFRPHALVGVVAAAPVGIGHDRLAADLMERDVLRRML